MSRSRTPLTIDQLLDDEATRLAVRAQPEHIVGRGLIRGAEHIVTGAVLGAAGYFAWRRSQARDPLIRNDVRIDLGRRRHFRAPTTPQVMARNRRPKGRKGRLRRGRLVKSFRRLPVKKRRPRRGRVGRRLPTRRAPNNLSLAMFRALTGK